MIRLKFDEQKKRILLAAAKIFREKSFLNTTIDDIASTLKINKATIYYYFSSKDDLLYEIVSNAINDLIKQAQIIVDSDDSPTKKMEALIKLHLWVGTDRFNLGGVAQFEMKNLSPKLLRDYHNRRDEYEKIYRDLLQKGMAMGEIRESDPNMTARFILGLVNSITTWFKRRGPLSIEQLGDQVWKFISLSIYTSSNRDKYTILTKKGFNIQRNIK